VTGLPGKCGKHGGSKTAQGRGVFGVEGIYKFLGVSKVSSRFPTIVSCIITAPFDEVLVLVTVLTTVEHTLYFIFKFLINLNRFRWWWVVAIDSVTVPGRETVDVEDWVLAH
jgi:hypothetical protein